MFPTRRRLRFRSWVPALIVLAYLLYLSQRVEVLPPAIHKPLQPADDPEYDGTLIWRTRKVQNPVDDLRPLPTGPPLPLPRVQTTFRSETAMEREIRLRRRTRVKAAFGRSWHTYKSYAMGKDEVTPVSGEPRQSFGGWGATLVDSLDTLWLMGMQKEFSNAVDAAANISFAPDSTTDEEINVFETNIRYLGGFLSAYDLSGDQRLLRKAREVGDMLLVAFDTPNHMPLTRWKLQDAARGETQHAQGNTLLAEIGSMSMEFTRLSIVTGDPRYFDAVQRVMEHFRDQQDSGHMPGMWPVIVDAGNAKFNEYTSFTLGAMADSMYEYLPKMHALVGGLLPMYRDMYEKAMVPAIKHNFFRPMLPDESDVLIAGMVDVSSDGPPELRPEGQHLACFTGGMLALGGRLVENKEHVATAEKLMDGCVWTYRAMPHGIMPETFYAVPCPGPNAETCPWDKVRWQREVRLRCAEDEPRAADVIIEEKRLPPGFASIPDTRYILRPEAIESVFVLYRVTGRADLQDAAWEMWEAIETATRTELAHSALHDVTVPKDEKPPMADSMESFWLGETLKYFYLIFSEPELISLDEWVFNTEAHPFRRLTPARKGWKFWL
ncbi:glycoside hydrolase family 47 protein [Thozetella sp. PMI_491]|nr:glycoside hydrolase family 47 protein [Thozetella sp. PMI_491]